MAVQVAAPVELKRRKQNKAGDPATQLATALFGDVLSPADWETMCDSISRALKSAKYIRHPGGHHHRSVTGIFTPGNTLIFGRDISDFAKRIEWAILAIAITLQSEPNPPAK
jgi:hypothetical protein